jgi:hypothetical protein
MTSWALAAIQPDRALRCVPCEGGRRRRQPARCGSQVSRRPRPWATSETLVAWLRTRVVTGTFSGTALLGYGGDGPANARPESSAWGGRDVP